LRVDHFRLPPDFRRPQRGTGQSRVPNTGLTVPVLRFPQWHFCPQCKRLDRRKLSERNRISCPHCEKRRFLAQVPFVAMCDRGHLQDFPWREWVHRSAAPNCQGTLKLEATGGASLASQRVRCEACGSTRSLVGVTSAAPDGSTSVLSSTLDRAKEPYLCRGHMPWHGSEQGSGCQQPLRGSLRSAANVYFAQVVSSIYLPRGTDAAPSELVDLVGGNSSIDMWVKMALSTAGPSATLTPVQLRNLARLPLQPFSDEQIAAAFKIYLASKTSPDEGDDSGATDDSVEDEETAFRRDEFNVLREAREERQLKIREAPLSSSEDTVRKKLGRVMLVDKLRETRALAGFNRVFAEVADATKTPREVLRDRKAMLWRNQSGVKEWLPAYTVFGEGIFLEFDEARLAAWEAGELVRARAKRLEKQYAPIRERRRLQDQPVTARYVLLHTFAHLLVNRLTFECGYSSASLRERLFVSSRPEAPMAGVLIYTAAGDSEGTMGGLVRMGKPGNLDPVIRRALEGAQWCSTDPVCMEMGEGGGQGPDSCNMAACHNCALVPETACEGFNRFLDRGLVVGTLQHEDLGYFSA